MCGKVRGAPVGEAAQCQCKSEGDENVCVKGKERWLEDSGRLWVYMESIQQLA